MNRRQWLPDVALDEVVPATADRPDDFLEGERDGSWYVRPRDGDAEARGSFDIALPPGQIVPFVFNDEFGALIVEVGERTLRVEGPAYPDHADCFDCDEVDGLFGSVREFVDTGNDGARMPPGIYQVVVYYWSSPIDFRFELPGTEPQLVPVDGLPLDDEARR